MFLNVSVDNRMKSTLIFFQNKLLLHCDYGCNRNGHFLQSQESRAKVIQLIKVINGL